MQVRNGRPTYMVVIENQKLVNSDISAFIKYLYTEELEPYLATNPVKTLYIAEFFEVESLHKAAIQRLETGLQTLIDAKYWVNFRRQARKIPSNSRSSPKYTISPPSHQLIVQ